MHDLNDGVITIGTVGRFDPLKDYSNMIDACSLIMNKYKNVNLMMIGKGLAPSNATLISLLCKKMDLSRIYLLGERDNVNNFLEVIDIFCMSSSNEGFPNALCEAMLMSKPCVVTDAGDMSNIVSETGIIVPIRDHIKLASGLEHMIKIGASGRKSLGKMAAIRIKSNYPIEKNVSMFTDLYLEVIDEK